MRISKFILVDGTFLIPAIRSGAPSRRIGTCPLALPIMAPWLTELQAAEFRAPSLASLPHSCPDGYAKDFFLKQLYETFAEHFSDHGIEFQKMGKPGDTVKIDS